MARTESLQGRAGVKGNVEAGAIEEMLEEVRVQCKAKFGERQQLGWIFGVICSEHPSGCGGGFGERFGAVDDGDAHTASVKFHGK
jgi:hypothetical protein